MTAELPSLDATGPLIEDRRAARRAAWRSGARPWMLLCAWLGIVVMTGDPARALEYRVKAGYLFNFAKFVEWPAGAFASEDSPFVVAVLGNEEAGAVVSSALEGKTVDRHPVRVMVLPADTRVLDAHIVLLTRTAQCTPEEAKRRWRGGAKLWVGETEEFAERGGAIGFVQEDQHVRLTLCLEHATEAGLKVSAKLASIARAVKPRRNR